MPELLTMAAEVSVVERLTPHDLVTYFRCPREMELRRHEHQRLLSLGPADALPTLPLRALRHSPLLGPPTAGANVVEGRLRIGESDYLIYLDDEEDLPVLFPPERVRLDSRFTSRPRNLHDDALAMSGRPDFVVARPDGSLFPIEYKATHLFAGLHGVHGRAFDILQAIAECRLVEAAFGRRPATGIVLYGDAKGGGEHEGFVEVPYGDSEAHWLAYALATVRADRERAPVPSDHTCPHCSANRLGLCGYAATRYQGGDARPPSRGVPPLIG